MKRAVVINGIADKVKNIHFLTVAIRKLGYETELIDILETEQKLGNIKLKEEPQVIIGFSLGGLMAIELAEKYPGAKLILVATGCRVEPKSRWLQWLKRVCQEEWGVKLTYEGIRLLPTKWLVEAYKRVNPAPKGSGQIVKDYEEDMRKNVAYFRKIPLWKWQEVTTYVNEVDNREICLQLKNKTLILAGKKDTVLGKEMGEELNRLMKNSQLVLTEGGHFDTIEKQHLKILEEWLK